MPDSSSHFLHGPFVRRFLGRLPPDVAGSFTADQLLAVQRVFGMRYAMGHRIDLRRTVRLPWGRFYFVLLAGRDERGHAAPRARAVAVALAMGVLSTGLMLLA